MKLLPDFVSEFVSISDTVVVRVSSIDCVWLEGGELKLTLESSVNEVLLVNSEYVSKLLDLLELTLSNK